MARPADSLAAMNERLKGAGIRLKVMARGNKLYLRGTLPPKKGETKPKQRYLSLGLDDTPYGLKTAELKAHELWSQLGQGTFQWETWTETEQDTCQAWIDRYKRHWFAVNGDTPQTQTKWKRQEWQMGLRWLPPPEKISSTVLETTVLNRPPNSRARQLCIQVLNRFAEYAAVEVDFDKFRGKYTKRKKPLEIPSDADIARLRANF
jgi:hypothetical protein